MFECNKKDCPCLFHVSCFMRVIGNFTFEEIAKITGKTANWARVKYFRGKEKLKEKNRDEERM